jgi:hypothetical protein
MNIALFTVLTAVIATDSASAAVTPFLRSNPAVLLVQGADTDATRLYESINVAPTQGSGNFLEKTLTSPSGLISLLCRHAPTTSQTTCKFEIKRHDSIEISESLFKIYTQSAGTEDAQYFYHNLVKDDQARVPMYVSEKQDLTFSSQPNLFVCSYRKVQ